MSECLSPIQTLKFKDAIAIGGLSPNLTKSFVEVCTVALSLNVKNNFLNELHKTKSSSDFTYIEIVNSQLTAFQLLKGARLENRFSNICNKVKNVLRKGIGAKRNLYLNESVSVSVYENEIYNVSKLSHSIDKFNQERYKYLKKCSELHESLMEVKDLNNTLQNENNLLKVDQACSERAKELYVQTAKKNNAENLMLRQQADNLKSEVETMKTQIKYITHQDQKLETENVKLLKYVNELETKCMRGPGIDSSSSLKLFSNEAERALWFAESFGLLPEALICRRSDSGKAQVIKFTDLKGTDKDKIRDLVYILDKFSISNSAYYELSILHKTLPRKYLIAQERENLNKLFHIERCPGNVPGAYVSMKHEIVAHIEQQLISPGETVKIKVSGDGAKMSIVSSFVTLSLSFPSLENCASVQNIKTLAILKCKESYEDLQVCASPVFKELNELISSREITLNEDTYKLDIFFGGDMKFIDICLGICGPAANYACPWCHVHKDDRTNLSKPAGFYESECMKRTERNVQENSELNKYGCKNSPLVKIDPSKIIPDELHLLMRISDILLKNLIDDCKQQDSKLEVLGEKPHHLQDLVLKINECGVPFHIWTERSSGEIQWTALTGSAYKVLLERLPSKLLFVIANDTHDQVVNVWRDFRTIYKIITGEEANCIQRDQLFQKTNDWGVHFLELRKCGRLGYDKITPYMHCFIYHVPTVVSKIGSMSNFSGQGIEKLNDEIKSIHLRRTNKCDQTMDDLATRKRLEFLSDTSNIREKQAYTKRDIDYWGHQKGARHAEKRKKIVNEISNVHQEFQESQRSKEKPIEEMTDREIKLKLKSLGVNTKFRKREKLINLMLSSSDYRK